MQNLVETSEISLGNIVSVVVHAFIGWAPCGATIGIGMATTSMENTLVIHAFAAPMIFSGLSLSYFNRPGSFTPLVGAIAFVVFVMGMDLFIVALIINRSLEMFSSVLGTWLPFALIFTSTYLTGKFVAHRQRVSNSGSTAQSIRKGDGR